MERDDEVIQSSRAHHVGKWYDEIQIINVLNV